jgi:uncharacterized protein (TIGR03435 family)
MKRLMMGGALVVLLSVSTLGQAPAPRPSFDAASVQISTRPNPGMRGGQLRGNRYELRNATMVDLIRTAYNVQPELITGGPSWLEWNRFDIAALAPEGTPPERLRDMLKALLADRFALAVREDTTTVTAMALKAAPTHKLKEVPSMGGCQGQQAPEPNGVIAQHANCNGVTMALLVEQLPRVTQGYFPAGQQVVDETGLAGFWEFRLKWTPRPLLAQAGSDGITIQAALKEVGLSLEPKEITVPAIAVETVKAEFTSNAPDLAKRLPPPPDPEFEVAVLKPAPPDAQGTRAQLLPTGQVNISNAPLRLMMSLAWNLPNEQFVTGPGWLESARFDVTARAFATASPANNAQLDEDFARLMLRRLIVDRFQVKYRMEDRPMPAYVLVADEPKMTKADGTKRTRCFEGAPAGSAAAAKGPQFGRQVTCQNISMEQFGQLLPSIAAGYTRVPAIDKTGLQGGFDFTLNFSPIGQVLGQRPDAAAGTAPTGQAADPTGALSLPDAVRRQLGVKLEDTKRPAPVLVIDSINEKPLDN